MNKEVRSIVKRACKQGWQVRHGNRHLTLIPPDPAAILVHVTTSQFGSAAALCAFKQRMKKAGLRD